MPQEYFCTLPAACPLAHRLLLIKEIIVWVAITAVLLAQDPRQPNAAPASVGIICTMGRALQLAEFQLILQTNLALIAIRVV